MMITSTSSPVVSVSHVLRDPPSIKTCARARLCRSESRSLRASASVSVLGYGSNLRRVKPSKSAHFNPFAPFGGYLPRLARRTLHLAGGQPAGMPASGLAAGTASWSGGEPGV